MSADDVTQLVLRERQGRDRGWYHKMAACFADDSIVRMSWFTGSGADFVRQTRAMAGRGDHAVHRLSSPAVRIHGDRALVELPRIIEWRIDIDGVEADLASACAPVPVLPGTHLAVDAAELAGYRPSYRFLARYLNRKGYTVGDHHLGDDQPEAVAEQYHAEHTWLHQSPTTPASSADPRKEQHS
ncbi:nuclear transport factor 2 family protein [Streptomyces sp. MK7]|uniref:nuclear transport factor 2 family protein n=1 Tax=Streptomyces sp. MK7 TaxID=3067635 RepID=UPI00293123E1|nr:nuclear transport factor 2 family protein [Streptomyces sp. MK7]